MTFYTLSEDTGQTLVRKFEERCEEDETTGCITWTGTIDSNTSRPNYVMHLPDKKRKIFDVRRFLFQHHNPQVTLEVSKVRCFINMTCNKIDCVNVDHMDLGNNIQRWDPAVILERLTSKCSVQDSPVHLSESCLIWSGYTRNGYGQMSVQCKTYDTHVLALLLHLGLTEQPKGENGRALHARHKCQNTQCVRASHLEFGTPSENGQDRIRDGTSNSGEKNASHVISQKLAQLIKLSWTESTAVDHKSVAERSVSFSVPVTIIKKIDSGLCWSDLPGGPGRETQDQKAIEVARRAKIAKDLRERGLTAAEYQKLRMLIISKSLPTDGISKDSEINTPCQVWQGRYEQGYGKLMFKYVQFKAHVIVCEALMGKTPTGYVVAHKCGNKCCVAPDHLTLATYQENGLDSVRHGDANCKLSVQDVHAIKMSCDLENAETLRIAANDHNITIAHVKQILKGRSWSWLSDPKMMMSA